MPRIIIFSICLLLLSCQRNGIPQHSFENAISDSLNYRNEQLLNSLYDNFSYCFLDLNSSASLINENFDTVSISSVIKQNNTLFFYFSNYACSPCLNEELELLKLEEDSITTTGLCIIGATRSMRSIAAVVKNHHFQCRIFQMIDSVGLIKGKDFIKESILLLVDKNGRIQTTLVPPKNDEKTMLRFFTFINDRFFTP